MQTTSFTSAPSATAELATVNLNAIIGQAGGGGQVKVINTGVQEVEKGVFVATAYVEIIEAEPEPAKDENKMSVQDRIGGEKEQPEDGIVHIYYLQNHPESLAERSIPDVSGELIQNDGTPLNIAQAEERVDVEDRRAENINDDILLGPDSLGGSADDMAEKVITDFNDETAVIAAATPAYSPAMGAEELKLTDEELKAVLQAREDALDQKARDIQAAAAAEPKPVPTEG